MTLEARPSLALERNVSPDLTYPPNWQIFLPTRCLSTKLDSENEKALLDIVSYIENRQHRLSRDSRERPHTESLNLIWRNWEEISSSFYSPDTHFFLKPQCFIEVSLSSENEQFGQPDIIGVTGTGDVFIVEIGRTTDKSSKARKYERGMKVIFNGRTERINLYPLVANYSYDSSPKTIIINYPKR